MQKKVKVRVKVATVQREELPDAMTEEEFELANVIQDLSEDDLLALMTELDIPNAEEGVLKQSFLIRLEELGEKKVKAWPWQISGSRWGASG